MALTVTVVVGNPQPGSRTSRIATALAERLFAGAETSVIELTEYASELFVRDSERITRLSARVAASDVAVFATPTYKASYTGLLKAFLDRYGSGGLAGTVAIPLHTGADLGHSLAPMVALTPLLTELGAVVPGRGVYVVAGDLSDLDEVVGEAADRLARDIAAVARIAPALAGEHRPSAPSPGALR
ncbi:MAG: NADPH-dependent FMN reductase [Microbacterium sp.]